MSPDVFPVYLSYIDDWSKPRLMTGLAQMVKIMLRPLINLQGGAPGR